MLTSAAVFSKTRISLWRDRLLALGFLVIGCWLVSAAFQAHGHEIICLTIQVSACMVLLAAAGLSVFMLGRPELHVDKIGISENGFMLNELNWSMTWNDIAYAEVKGRPRNRIVLVGLDSDLPEHVLGGYDHFNTIVGQISDGLRRFGRRVIEADKYPSPYLP